MSLDGVMEDPAWTFQFASEEQKKYEFDELAACDALSLGRRTYEEFAAAWPSTAGASALEASAQPCFKFLGASFEG